MAESDLHRQLMTNLIEALACHFRGREVCVSGHLMLYYERGNPKASLSPDVLATLDRPSHPARFTKRLCNSNGIGTEQLALGLGYVRGLAFAGLGQVGTTQGLKRIQNIAEINRSKSNSNAPHSATVPR